MSISVIDYTGDYINKDILPNDLTQLIICEEFCLVPDNLQAVLLVALDYQKLSVPGMYIFRIPNDFYRGITYGHIYSFSSSAKFYTSRYDVLSSFIPNANLLEWSMPYKLITHRAGKIEKFSNSLKENSLFDQIYLESLSKLTKMYLINKYTRVNKTKSLKSQLKNLVEGIMSSNRKRNGKFIEFSADSLVEVIINDLETYGIIMCGLNIHYNEQTIEEFFGEFKSKVFVPCHKLSGAQVARNANKEEILKVNQNSNPSKPLKPLKPAASHSARGEDSKCRNLLTTPNPDLDRTEESSLKIYENFKRPAQNLILPTTAKGPQGPQGPGLGLSGQFRPAISKVAPFLTLTGSKVWEQHEALVFKQATQTLLESFNQVDNILKLFRICNRTVRDHIRSANLSFEDSFISDVVRRMTETLADKYFTTDNSLSFTDFFEKIESSVPIKLYKKLN